MIDNVTILPPELSKLTIGPDASVKDALKRLSHGGEKFLAVVGEDIDLMGVLTDGNLRRHIISTGGLEGTVADCFNAEPLVFRETFTVAKARRLMISNKIEAIPVVNSQGRLIDVCLWSTIFAESEPSEEKLNPIDCPVVIMAGGKGTRLDPFTRILPKPLVPIGNTPIIEIIMGRLALHGVDEFLVSVNHKAYVLKAYFHEKQPNGYKVDFLEEEIPLGTAGGLSVLAGKIPGSLIVTNCDIIIEHDYAEIIDFHDKSDADITIVGAIQHMVIPYGVCDIESGGRLKHIREKPEYDFLVNTGMYIVKGGVLDLIPRDEYFDFPDLITKVRDKDGQVCVFPVNERSWIDVGQWEEYRKVVAELDGKH